MRFRPVIDLKGARVRDGYAELGRMLRRRPVEHPQWRDFWKVWIGPFALVMVALKLLDTEPFSATGALVLLAGVLTSYAVVPFFRRAGWIGTHERLR